jgi:flagellin
VGIHKDVDINNFKEEIEMRINHNIAALNTYRQLTNNTSAGSQSLEKLSSGLRINRAGDDAAGLAISEKMRGQIRGLDMASKNAQDGISFIQTAEGALNETHSIIQRMRELAVQSSNDTNTEGDRGKLQSEVDQLAIEITRISNTTEFNTRNLLNGGVQDANAGAVKFHIGANADQNLSLSISAMDASSLGIARDVKTAALTNEVGITAVDISTSATIAADAYTISAVVTAATSGQVADATASGGTVATSGGSITFTIDGVSITANITSGQTLNDLVTAMNAAASGALGVATDVAKLSGSNLVLTSITNGTDSNAQINSVSNMVQLNVDATAQDIGSDASMTVTLTGANTGAVHNSAAVALDATSVTFAAGVTLTKSATATTSGGIGGTVTVAQTDSSAATFANGEQTAAAVAAGGIDISTQANANTAISTLNAALESVSDERSKLGAFQNRLDHTINNLGTTAENLTASESRIRDVDMAKEMMEFTKNNILTQAAQAMLAQANQQPQGVLQLLR